jgi:bifunctional enzyme CysN/CysC
LRESPEKFQASEATSRTTAELLDELSQADVAVIVVSSSSGLGALARHEILLASLAGIERIIVALDRAEAPDEKDALSSIEAEYRKLAEQLGVSDVFVSRAAAVDATTFAGVEGSRMRLGKKPLRFSVTGVATEGLEGTLESGELARGHNVRLPAGRTTRVEGLLVNGASAEHAEPLDALTIKLADPSGVRAGDLISAADRPAEVADQFEATVVWLGDAPLLRGRNYLFEIGARRVTATIGALKFKTSIATFERVAAGKFERDDIGVCNLRLDAPVAFDPHRDNPRTGRFRLVDSTSGATVGVGFLHFALRRAQNVHWQAIDVNKVARSSIKGQKPCVLWYTGLSGAGKSTIANLVDKKLHAAGRHTYLLDGDNVRHGLNKDLGFTAADRVENIRRIAEVAKLMVDAGLIVGTAFISPFRAERSMARTLLGADEFFEVYVDTPLGVAEERDPKGLYKKARRGELKNFTGIDSPYEPPENPDLRIDTTATSPEAAADVVVAFLESKGILDAE